MKKIEKTESINPEVLKYIIDQHKMLEIPRLLKLEDYYRGKHAILQRVMSDNTKPNNKLINPYANYITDMFCGYFLGEPVSYNSKEDKVMEELNLILTYNDEADENSEIARDASIYGVGYEMMYFDSDKAVRFKKINPKEVILIYDNTVEEEMLYAIRYYAISDITGKEIKTRVEVYSAATITVYEGGQHADSLTFVSEEPHYFGLVPFVVYKNNDDMIGDFELIISLIDAYDKLSSDNLNDFEYFTDSYLGLYGMDADVDDIKLMKENRVLLMPEGGKAEWIIKNVNDSQIENIKTRIEQDIHKFSKCPALTDQDFASNASGVAMKYKLMGMENVAATKERKFKRGLQRRIELLSNILSLTSTSFDWRSIDITFRRNIPANITEIADVISRLRGLLSDETLISQIPFVENTQAEMKKIADASKDEFDIFKEEAANEEGTVLE